MTTNRNKVKRLLENIEEYSNTTPTIKNQKDYVTNKSFRITQGKLLWKSLGSSEF